MGDNGIADVNEESPAPEPVPLAPTVAQTEVSEVDALESNWFAADAELVLSGLEALDAIVIDYPVCSESVAEGEVRRIVDSNNGVALLDRGGVTAAGLSIAPGTVIEVKVGTGDPCLR